MLTEQENLILKALKSAEWQKLKEYFSDDKLKVDRLFAGKTLLHEASLMKDASCSKGVRLLLVYGASTKILDKDGKDPIHSAIDCKNKSALKVYAEYQKIQEFHLDYARSTIKDDKAFLSFLRVQFNYSNRLELEFDLLFSSPRETVPKLSKNSDEDGFSDDLDSEYSYDSEYSDESECSVCEEKDGKKCSLR